MLGRGGGKGGGEDHARGSVETMGEGRKGSKGRKDCWNGMKQTKKTNSDRRRNSFNGREIKTIVERGNNIKECVHLKLHTAYLSPPLLSSLMAVMGDYCSPLKTGLQGVSG